MLRWAAVTLTVIVAVLAAIQVVRPARTNPPIDADNVLQAHVGNSAGVAVIARACRDCHTHQTAWPWYSHVAPVSWLLVRDVNTGRRAVNFSTWSAYDVEQQEKLLREACETVSNGEMPIEIYAMMHREARLTRADAEAICAIAPRDRE